jgi:hypothetical protein
VNESDRVKLWLDGGSGCRSMRELAEYLERRACAPVDEGITRMTSKEYQLVAGALRHFEMSLRAEAAVSDKLFEPDVVVTSPAAPADHVTMCDVPPEPVVETFAPGDQVEIGTGMGCWSGRHGKVDRVTVEYNGASFDVAVWVQIDGYLRTPISFSPRLLKLVRRP